MFTLGRNTGSRYASEHMHYTYVCIDIVVVPTIKHDRQTIRQNHDFQRTMQTPTMRLPQLFGTIRSLFN